MKLKYILVALLILISFDSFSQSFYDVKLNSIRKYTVDNPFNNKFAWKIFNANTGSPITNEAKFYDNYFGVPGVVANEILNAGDFIVDRNTIFIKWMTPGKYKIEVTERNSNDCINTSEIYINVEDVTKTPLMHAALLSTSNQCATLEPDNKFVFNISIEDGGIITNGTPSEDDDICDFYFSYDVYFNDVKQPLLCKIDFRAENPTKDGNKFNYALSIEDIDINSRKGDEDYHIRIEIVSGKDIFATPVNCIISNCTSEIIVKQIPDVSEIKMD